MEKLAAKLHRSFHSGRHPRGGAVHAHGRGRGRHARGEFGCLPGDPDLMLPWARREGLVSLPSANNSLAPYQRVPPKRCAIFIDRHVHKNGGSTVRDLLLENERLGLGLYQGYTQMYWRSINHKLRQIADAAVSKREAPRHFLMLEAHFG